MNIELIKKYKTEFDHWLNGGKLLAKLPKKGWIEYYGEDIWCHSDISIVIDDEYFEFRKALAEGKTIQYNPKLQCHNRWDDVETHCDMFSSKPGCYRIKPEEPQFKIGDFVRVGCDGDSPKTIKIFHKKSIDEPPYVYIMKDSTKWDKCIKWDPYPKELCWFTTRAAMLDGVNYAVLGYFNTIVGLDYTTTDGATFRHCEPFLNSKPSWFK